MGWLIGAVVLVVVAAAVGVFYVVLVYLEAIDDAHSRGGYMNPHGGLMASVYDSGFESVGRKKIRKAENLERNRVRRGE